MFFIPIFAPILLIRINKMTTLRRITITSFGCLLLCTSCKDNATGGEDPTPQPKPLPTINYTNANLVYYGIENDITTSSHYKLTLYTDMKLDAQNNPIGPGQMLRFSLNANLFEESVTEFPLPIGTYTSASSWSDFQPGTFNYGFISEVDLPTGKVSFPDGSFFGDLPSQSTEFTPDLLDIGSFEVTRNDNDIYTLTGMVVGNEYLKRRFTYTGKLEVIDRSTPVAKPDNTTLTKDLHLTDLTQARLADKGDSFYLGDESYRTFELYLAAKEISLTPQWPTGNGNLVKVEFFVGWNVSIANGIPEGTYRLAPQDPSGGVDKLDIVPGNIVPGYPDKFTYPGGSWYEQLTNNKMLGYARITGGTMRVERQGDKHLLTIDLIDCNTKTPHHITASYTQDTPIKIFK